MTKTAYYKQVRKIKAQNDQRLKALQSTNQQYNQQLAQANQQLNQLNEELQGTQTALAGTQAELTQTKNVAANLQSMLSKTSAEAQGLKGQINSLKAGFAQQQAADRKAFENGLKKLKLSAAARAAKEAQFTAEAKKKAGQLQARVSGLEGQLRSTEGALAKAKEEIDTRRAVAKEISEGFAKAGIKADIDMQTGDVVLDFGDAYFDSNSADLKPKMRQVIERAMPIYSKSLFGNPKVASKISDVEIIGFASPTYQGRYIDPQSTKPEDKAALKYNMDLSYKRANAIFQHIVDEKNPGFANQQKLMSLMKVSGRSFLDVLKVKDRNVASAAEFCRVNDCRKAQRVIVRFSVDSK